MSRKSLVTTEQIAEIIRLKAAGLRNYEIANLMCVSQNMVWWYTNKPPPPPRKNPEPAGLTRIPKRVESVRCLGGCGKYFLSPDRLRIRVCDTCRKSKSWLSGPAIEHTLNF